MKQQARQMLEDAKFLTYYETVSNNFRPDGQAKPTEIVREEARFEPLQAELRYSSSRDVLEFVPAFEDVTSRSRGLKPSYGVSKQFGSSSVVNESDDDLPDWLLDTSEPDTTTAHEESQFVKMGPVGYKRQTSVTECSLRLEALLTGEESSQQAIQILQSYLVTFEATLKLAIATVFEMEEGDFTVTHQMGEERVHWFVYSSVSGSPISKMVFDDLTAPTSMLWAKMQETILHTTCCTHCCESCILLPRTPEFVVRQKLLDKEVLKQRWLAVHV